MSINVTVTGNPISIKRGKMVTCDSYQGKKEFEKRRLMRLEQVRQQSKDIAADVRNKVRREKKKQLRQIEEEGKQKLKNWQNRKLLELQTQYEEALHELGTGHKQAVDFEDEAEVLADQKEHSDKLAIHRGQVAATKLQIEKNKENLKKAIPIQQKKLVRDIENTRASLVSSIKKKNAGSTENGDKTRKRKQPVTDINITIPSSDSEESDLPIIDMLCSSEQDKLSHVDEIEELREEPSTSSCDCIDDSNGPRQPLGHKECEIGADSGLKSFRSVSPKNKEQTTETGATNFAKKIYERRKLIEEFLQKQSNVSPPLDTRISDRIKRRELMTSQPDYCDIVAKTHPTPFIESNTQLRDAIDAHNINNVPVEINCICGHKCPKICGSKSRNQHKKTQDQIEVNENDSKSKQGRLLSQKSQELSSETDIPEKPPIKLKDNYGSEKIIVRPSKETIQTYDSNKVSFYDHPNRFLQEKPLPANVHVEKITTDSLEVNPNVISEREWHEKMKQRDKEAKIRGQKALEKEKIQRDYEEMLKKLPLLQKKERICEITKDKQEYHMSEERLKERERKKQNDLDNAYAKLFPNLKPAVVTLPTRKHDKQVDKSPDAELIQSLNVGSWDVDQVEPKMFTAEEVQEIVKAFTEQKPQERRTKLKQLLKSLKLQKEQLINEIKSLPSNDSINELISDLRSFSDGDEKCCSRSRRRSEKSERKRRRDEHEKETSTDSTTEDSSSSLSKQGKEKTAKDKYKGRHSDGKTPSPRKKPRIKSKRRVLVLQNMSTQTTPKASTNSDQDKFLSKTDKISELDKVKTQHLSTDKEKPVCSKLHVPCDCNKENESTDELCQIVIKINENEDHEVVVKSKEKDVKILEPSKDKLPDPKKPVLKSVGVGTDELKESKNEKPVDHKVSSDSSQKKSSEKSKKVPVRKHKSDSKTVETKSSKAHEVDSTGSKAKSWREQLSKNSISTSSTSYFSPPDFQKTGSSVQSSANEQQKQSLYNLRKQPQQSNLSVSPSQTSVEQQTTDPKLLAYIQKLLSMSRGSIENLTVSTSSIQTPSQSVIEMESNNPLAQLHNLIKYVSLKDIGSNLSYSPDYSPIRYNTSASTSDGSQQPAHEKSADPGVDNFSKSGKTDQSSRVTTEKETSSCSARSKDSVLAQYAEITDSCSKRIAQLASMIEQIREEKIQMLQNPPTPEGVDKTVTADKDYSTAYLELPGSNESSSKYSSLNSLDDEELQKKLLEIDFSLAEKLRRFTSNKQDKRSDEDASEKEAAAASNDTVVEANNTNSELWSRLNRLMHQKEQPDPEIPSVAPQPSRGTVSFVPFLSDIPKLPKLEAQPENSSLNHKRPPPSKGLTVARKFNENISLVPHELSTIVEADSQISTKLGSANNSRTSQDISPRKDFELVVQPEIEEESSMSKSSSKSDKASPSQMPLVSVMAKPKSPNIVPIEKPKEKDTKRSKISLTSPNHSSEGSSQSVLLTSSRSSSSKKSIQLSTNSSDDMETIEAMLRSIGMEWAIPTLHKTKEALALTSSSSSLELSSKKQILSNNSSGSEVSLKQYLKKQIKISSSTLRSDMSPASFSGDLSELSSIQVNNSNAEKSHQRTSTPIISSKSTEKSSKKVIFTGDSDISSVKDEAQKYSDKSNINSFRSLSEYSQSKSDI